jgi:hypothetical protein
VCGAEFERPFTMPSDSAISFLAKGAAFGIGPCGRTNPPDDILNGGLAGGLLATYDLPAGSYYLRYGPAPGTMTPTGDASAALNPVCAGATDLAAIAAARRTLAGNPPQRLSVAKEVPEGDPLGS